MDKIRGKFKKAEKFKIYEYSDHALLLPVDEDYEECLFFFAGFNENASKYIYLLKFFLESLPRLAIKVIIPFLPRYSKEEYPTYWLREPERFQHVYAWYTYEIINLPEGFTTKINPNTEKDQFVMKMVREEIKVLGSSNKIMFVGFSMGGRYLLQILTKLKIKTKFNLIFKSILLDYKNPYKVNNKEGKNDEQPGEYEDISNTSEEFNDNLFYLYYSLFDKVVQFQRGVKSIEVLKEKFKKGNVHVRTDNNNKHAVDEDCLYYLATMFKKHKIRPKF